MDAIIFDWSGTLSDDRIPVYETNKKMHERWGIPIPPFQDWIKAVRANLIDFYRTHGVQATDDEIRKLYKKFFQEGVDSGIQPTLYPDARSTLMRVRELGLVVAIVSAHPTSFLEREAKDCHVNELLNALLGDSNDKSDSLKQICTQLNISPSESMYVGDTIYDIRFARAAGLMTGGITTGYHTREALKAEQPDFLFDNLSEIINVINV